jgi:Mn2+/Fe2+ NRAMP family transporter
MPLQVAQILNIVQSLVLPFALVAVLRVCAEAGLMGRFVSHPALTLFGSLTAAAVTGINSYLVITFIEHSGENKVGSIWEG